MAAKKKPHRPPARPAPKPAAAAVPPARTADLVRRGREAFGAGEYAAAARAWQDALRAGGDDRLRGALAEAWFRAGLAAKEPSEATQALTQALNLQPERPRLHYHLGLTYLRRGDIPRAITSLRAARERAPEDDRVRFHLAFALLRRGTPEAAAEALALAPAKPAPESHWPCLRVAALLAQGNLDAAMGVAVRARADGRAVNDLALARAMIGILDGDLEFGVDGVRELAEKAPGTPSGIAAAYLMGVRLWHEGDMEDARKWWAQAAENGFPAAEAEALWVQQLHERAAAAVREGDLDAAGDAWRRIAQVKPDDDVARTNLRRLPLARGDVRARAGDLTGAAVAWEEALRGEPDNHALMQNLALAYQDLNRKEDAARLWQRIVDAWRKDTRRAEADEEIRKRLALAYRQLGWLYGEAEDFRKAIQELRNGLRFDPTDLKARSLLADAYYTQEQWSAARAEVDKILGQDPTNVRGLILRARLELQRGDTDASEATLRALLAKESEHREAQRLLGRLMHGRMHEAWRHDDDAEIDRLLAEWAVLAPGDPVPYLAAGDFAVKDAKAQRARRFFERALAVRDDVETMLSIGRLYLENGKSKPAMTWFKKSAERDPSPENQVAIARALEEENEPWSAIRPFAEAAAAGDNPNVLAHVALLAQREDETQMALAWATKAVSLDPENVTALLALGTIYHALRDRRADEALDKAERFAARESPAAAEAIRRHRVMLDAMRDGDLATLGRLMRPGRPR